MMPNAVLQHDTPREKDKRIDVADLLRSGYHYFDATKTPIFDMGTKKEEYGIMFCAKLAGSPAPAGAPKGQGGEGFGSVDWLKLGSKTGSVGFEEIYRINTAGGSAPPTCDGMPKTFEVEYATE